MPQSSKAPREPTVLIMPCSCHCARQVSIHKCRRYLQIIASDPSWLTSTVSMVKCLVLWSQIVAGLPMGTKVIFAPSSISSNLLECRPCSCRPILNQQLSWARPGMLARQIKQETARQCEMVLKWCSNSNYSIISISKLFQLPQTLDLAEASIDKSVHEGWS